MSCAHCPAVAADHEPGWWRAEAVTVTAFAHRDPPVAICPACWARLAEGR